MTVLPYKAQQGSKKEQVAQMFDNISPKYDLLNRLLSLGIDVYWRKLAIKELQSSQPQRILDVATGTADFALQALSLKPTQIVGVDISEGMLAQGREKIQKMGLSQKIILQKGDSEGLAFDDQSFDAVIAAFGVRNFENLEKGLSDMARVLKSGGKMVVLEFSQPEMFPFKQIYNFYFTNVLPLVGKSLSKDDSAYSYLPESVQAFPYGKDFLAILEKIGLKNGYAKRLTFGISSIYVATKA